MSETLVRLSDLTKAIQSSVGVAETMSNPNAT